jgi:Tfp pilus assembly protein PilP
MKRNSKVNYFELGLYAAVGTVTSLLAFYAATSTVSKSKAQAPAPVGAPAAGAAGKSPVFDKEILNRISDNPELLNQTLEAVYDYDSKGKRDPFQPYFGQTELTPGAEIGPITFLQRFELKELKLIGIIWDVSRPKAMIMTPSGNVYVVEVNTKIGRSNAYIGAIREGEIVVVEPFEDEGKKSYTTKVIAIGKAD